MSRELVIYTDESSKKGRYFANFYGGALVRSQDVDEVRHLLASAAAQVGIAAEMKWQKVSSGYLDRYIRVVDAFFGLVAQDRVKVRIMFTQKLFVPTNLTAEQRENEYHLLYYQFLKHAFGLKYCNAAAEAVRLRIYLDNLPDTKEKNARFKGYIAALEKSKEFRSARILVPADQIAEVRSHDHVVLQCLDVVLGAMQFRLNDLHKEKPAGQLRRGSRTIAKETLYRHINKRIREIYPHFNVGISTGVDGDVRNRWRHPYRHWLFIPAEWELDQSRKKPK